VQRIVAPLKNQIDVKMDPAPAIVQDPVLLVVPALLLVRMDRVNRVAHQRHHHKRDVETNLVVGMANAHLLVVATLAFSRME